MKSYKTLILLFLFNPVIVLSQSDPKLSVFTFNPIMYNPAYAGSYDGLTINSIYSTQWVGFDGAPKTLLLSGHSILSNSNTGAGFDIMSDKIGAVSENNINGNFAYHLNLSETIRLSLGLKAGVNLFNIDYNQFVIQNPNENDLADRNVSQSNLMIGSGAYVYNEKWAIGLSIPNMLKTVYINNRNNQIANKNPYYFITGAYKIIVDDEIFLKPNFVTRITDGAPISTLIALNLDWKDKLVTSLNFEMNASIGGFVGFRFFENFLAGYSYDLSVNDFSKYNGGVHTFIVTYRLGDYWSKKKCSCFTF
ncbi:type IX secretion system membrane protein PorP/SprF [Flavobacterium myungsuense]|uniref:Type IX secretion system membrane protein PorP/SprF n=1 Tax=Flavobacterium myungsuense TaxID=651823 RepID=A0ABW3J0P7_9FLAO